MKTTSALALALAIFCAPLHAQTFTSGALIDGKFDAASRAVRSQIARDLLTRVNAFADLVPTPKPTDVAWVDAENAALSKISDSTASFNRTTQFYESVEFQNVKLYNVLQSVRSALACVLDTNVPVRREIYCWASASLLLSNQTTYSDGIRVLRQSNKLPDTPVTSTAQLLFSGLGRGIQEYVVLPYLRGDIK